MDCIEESKKSKVEWKSNIYPFLDLNNANSAHIDQKSHSVSLFTKILTLYGTYFTTESFFFYKV